MHSIKKPTDSRIAALRAAMAAKGVFAYLIPCSDPHGDEFLPAHFTACNWLSGFTGDSCTLVVTEVESALWVDGRYFVQAEEELAGTEVKLMKMKEPGVPTVEEHLAQVVTGGKTLGFDGSMISGAMAKRLEQELCQNGAGIQNIDLIGGIWQDRPALPKSDCWLLAPESAGETAAQKLSKLREMLGLQKADAFLEAKLDCTAWLCNLRAADIDCTPYALAFCYVDAAQCLLFLDPARVSKAVQTELAQNGVSLREYSDIVPFLQTEAVGTVLRDENTVNAALCTALAANPAVTVLQAADPLPLLKSVKNAGELAATRECHLADGAAMVRFQMELERRLAAGETLAETDIDEMLHRQRSALPGFITESFTTIAACGANAASMHYHATAEHHSALCRRGFLLVDCGGTYQSGTTDITRTYALGALTRQEKEFYTWTLASHIDMAGAVFLNDCTGGELDMLARQPLWRHLINYRCGTGHGVAHVGAVHEGPQSLRPHNAVVFAPGMIVTDEPGVYEGGQVGIRIENELEVVFKAQNQYGTFLGFEPLTFVPIDLAPVLPEELSRTQKDWLNAYHAAVYQKLSPRLTEPEAAWLKAKTAPLD